MARTPAFTPESLLADARWLRGLAHVLARPGSDAEDLVQATYLAALESPPDADRPARPWLAQVARNVARFEARTAGRRRSRELAAAHAIGDEAPGTDEMLERLRLQRALAGHVAALDEPYRTTVLLRFYEGLEPSDIARTQGIPAGTVRWRLSEACKRLRARLDDETPRATWMAVLAPAAPSPRKGPSRAAATGGSKVIGALAGVSLLTAVAVGVALRTAPQDGRMPATLARGATRVPLVGLASDSPMKTQTREKETAMKKASPLTKTLGAAGAFVVPMFVAAAASGDPLPRAEAIDVCVELKEKALACKDELADRFAASAPVDRRAQLRAKALAEIVEEGSGPIAKRRQTCAANVDEPKPWVPFGFFSKEDVAALRACGAHAECKAALDCSDRITRAAIKRAKT